ncbi:hypothetical protein P7C71_g5960, partial [Lecanoromycetidae sp. Uapishka_2]
MPPPTSPPTPAASTEIVGKEHSPSSATERSFDLPPPAIAPSRTHGSSTTNKQIHSATSPSFTLPPPPTRSRTIIQMKPKSPRTEDVLKPRSQSGTKSSNKKATPGTGANGKKQPSSTSVAGKKIARKTAHSVIERRRRSKMNEEFATLKDMIPACTDQDMHKLAILQASIDYLRYLETCITDLKAANNSLSTPLIQPQAPPPRMRGLDEEEDDDIEDEDNVTMGNTQHNDASCFNLGDQDEAHSYTSPHSVTPSPALGPESHYQTSSYASSVSTQPFSVSGAKQHHHHHQGSQSLFPLSASTSPTINPNEEQDQEATAALLMLNKDRRNPKGVRGMSVIDLLSS